MSFVKFFMALLLALGLSGCLNSIEDDLHPSADDLRVTAPPGTSGDQPGQTAPDFTLPDSVGGSF